MLKHLEDSPLFSMSTHLKKSLARVPVVNIPFF